MIKKYLPSFIALVYFISPYDLLPDSILGLGWLDDLGVLALAWWWSKRFRGLWEPGSATTRKSRSCHGRHSADHQDEEQNNEAEDPYTVLGLERGASKEEVKAARRKMAVQYHPDKVQHLGREFQALAHKKFVAIQKAYDTLMK